MCVCVCVCVYPQVYTSRYNKVRIYKVLKVSKKSRKWLAGTPPL